MNYPFQNPDYERVPNYHRATEVETLQADALSQRVFESEYVNRNRPCLIRGAAQHWPAYDRWTSVDYLKSRCGDAEVKVHSSPVIEADALLSSQEKQTWLMMLRLTQSPVHMRFGDFLDHATDLQSGPSDDLLFLYSVPLAPGGPLSELGGDVGGYPFLKRHRPALFASYPRNNAFFYRSSLTDWHYHATAEALQTQVLGTKEVMLLPPSGEVWSYMFPLHSTRLHLYDYDLSENEQARQIVPLRAVLYPGDALYIPAFWWHLVSTRRHRGLGATVPTWWRTPVHVQCDQRFPVNRAILQAMLAGRPDWRRAAMLLPAMMAGAAWARLRSVAFSDVQHDHDGLRLPS